MRPAAPKTAWQGTVLGVQARIRLGRRFDERHHSYLGFVLVSDERLGGEAVSVRLAISKGDRKSTASALD